MSRTHPFTREELLEHARIVLAGHKSISGICPQGSDVAKQTSSATDAMAAVVALLESYPLANPAAECVRIICDDLETRGGFRELIEQIGATGWRDLREHLAKRLASTVVYTPPVTKADVGEEMEFA
jgi:hypothetical protein